MNKFADENMEKIKELLNQHQRAKDGN